MRRLVSGNRLSAFVRGQALRTVVRSLNIFEVVGQSDLASIPIENIRNFSIIAHVDHGKSTLADCLLEACGNINDDDRKRGQVLDSLQVERERGITVKAQTASMIFTDTRTNKRYLFNLIDTPGHVDFSYEVSRSLASCQGALLLVDSSQSIQAQTIANFNKAKELGLKMLPILTKIDLPNSQPLEAAIAMSSTFGLDPDTCIPTSAKNKIGIQETLEAIADQLPHPKVSMETEFIARVVGSWYDDHRGVICLVQVISGTLTEGQRITPYASVHETKDIDRRTEFSVQEIGVLTPTALRTKALTPGQVGYIVSTGMRSTRQARLGDTIYVPSEWTNREVVPLQGYEPAKQMLFASVYPVDPMELDSLYAAVDKLCLNDSSISVVKEQSLSLGSGMRVGFLGFLHMEVVMQRLQDEFNISVITTSPSVPYRIEFNDGTVEIISDSSRWPAAGRSDYSVMEPVVNITIVTPADYYGSLLELIKDKRGENMDIAYLEDGTIMVTALMPWQEVVNDMSDQVKSRSSGYASFNYVEAGYKAAKLVKVDVTVNSR